MSTDDNISKQVFLCLADIFELFLRDVADIKCSLNRLNDYGLSLDGLFLELEFSLRRE
jgi:hypothetical protein